MRKLLPSKKQEKKKPKSALVPPEMLAYLQYLSKTIASFTAALARHPSRVSASARISRPANEGDVVCGGGSSVALLKSTVFSCRRSELPGVVARTTKQ
jgi:1,6-anhydro-N-acetylmuramate kinase